MYSIFVWLLFSTQNHTAYLIKEINNHFNIDTDILFCTAFNELIFPENDEMIKTFKKILKNEGENSKSVMKKIHNIIKIQVKSFKMDEIRSILNKIIEYTELVIDENILDKYYNQIVIFIEDILKSEQISDNDCCKLMTKLAVFYSYCGDFTDKEKMTFVKEINNYDELFRNIMHENNKFLIKNTYECEIANTFKIYDVFYDIISQYLKNQLTNTIFLNTGLLEMIIKDAIRILDNYWKTVPDDEICNSLSIYHDVEISNLFIKLISDKNIENKDSTDIFIPKNKNPEMNIKFFLVLDPLKSKSLKIFKVFFEHMALVHKMDFTEWTFNILLQYCDEKSNYLKDQTENILKEMINEADFARSPYIYRK